MMIRRASGCGGVSRWMAAWVVLLLFVAAARGADIAVSAPPAGQDALPRIEAALEKAQPGDRVVLGAGEYRLSKHLTFPRGGQAEQPITLAAAPGDYVALLGSVRLTGWQRHDEKIWKVKRPGRLIKGLYEDAVRLTHPRLRGKRVDPPVSELVGPGMWTQDDEWVYLWSREGDTPDNHRIEASQHSVMEVNRPWIRVIGLRMFFGQNTVCKITADNVEVIRSEIAHCSNSVDNSYAAYFSGCSNSAFRECLIHDSFYWGDHGSNSHLVSTIDCGDNGPNFVDRCVIFNGGLGVGTKGAAREVVVVGSRIYDVHNGVMLAGERSSGPGAGKGDRGHYVVYGNWISQAARGIWAYGGTNRNNRVWNNVIEDCEVGIRMRNYVAEPKDLQLVNNIILDCDTGVLVSGGRKGHPTIDQFIDAGLMAHHNLLWGNGVAWRNPLTWTSELTMSLAELQEGYAPLGTDSIHAEPKLDAFGRSLPGAPGIGHGAELDLPHYIPAPADWSIGIGPWEAQEQKPDRGLTLSIAGSADSVTPGQTVALKAVLTNSSPTMPVTIAENRDAIITYRFGYRGWHLDKQEICRVRVELPARTLGPGEFVDLNTLSGWEDPVAGAMGEPLHLRTDTKEYADGARLRATLQFVDRDVPTAKALQPLGPMIWTQHVLPVELR